MLLTVVVVVSRHQAWIRPWLTTVLEQASDAVEIVLVDDASPDHTPRVVAEAAQGDPRVVVHRLEERVGRSEALRAGLERATGDYVWVLDPVDELLPGALPRLLPALDARPDVLLVPELLRDLYGGERPPSEPVGSRPLLRDRVVRRDHLLAHRTAPGDGFLELRLATAAVARANAVERLDEPVFAHRELPAKVRRQWAADDAFDVFAAYDDAFAALAGAGSDSGTRAALATEMLAHQRSLLAEVPSARRAVFFQQMSRSLAAHGESLPRPRGRVARAELEAIEKNRYPVFSALQRRRQLPRRSLRKALRSVPRGRKAAKTRGRQAFYAVQRRRPLLPDVAVYTAYWGSAFSCNPRAIYLRARELAPSVRGVWVVKAGSEGVLPQGVPYVVEGSRNYYRLMARATYFVNNANFANDIVKRPGQVHLQTHHGTPLKKMGLDLVHAKHSSMGLNFRRLMKRVERWDYSISANEFTTEIWERVYPSGTYESLETGYPRNDVLVTHTTEHRERVRAELGIEPGQTAVLYTPTHREYAKEYVPMLDAEALAEALGPDVVVLLRTHYFYGGEVAPPPGSRVRDVADHPSIEDLSIASDVLVTDYSSLMFDYAVLDRPIVIFAPDWETYRAERGTYFDLMAEPPGPVVTTQEALTEVLGSDAVHGAASTALRQAFHARFCALEDGGASERVVRALWPDRVAERPPA